MDKRQLQLGINPSTAAQRLRTDLLFNFVQAAGHVCHRCGGALSRETFSIEHKTPWLDSNDPKKLFFALDNIAYSHQFCNYSAARKPTKKWASDRERWADEKRRFYTPEKRHAKYVRSGH